MFRDLGHRLGEAGTLNSPGELASRTSATSQARSHYSQALAIARDRGAPQEEARPGRNRQQPPPRRQPQ
jgi:hypothetical protein